MPDLQEVSISCSPLPPKGGGNFHVISQPSKRFGSYPRRAAPIKGHMTTHLGGRITDFQDGLPMEIGVGPKPHSTIQGRST